MILVGTPLRGCPCISDDPDPAMILRNQDGHRDGRPNGNQDGHAGPSVRGQKEFE